MGKVRPINVKKTARMLIARFPDKFSTDFESNKKLIDDLTTVKSKKLRNRVAGYISSIKAKMEQTTEGESEDESEGTNRLVSTRDI